MNIGMNSVTGQFMRVGMQKHGIGKSLTGMTPVGKHTAGSAQILNPSMRMRMAEMNATQSMLPQAKRDVIYDAASGTTFDAQRTERAVASAQKKMKKLQYNFKLISTQIMRAKTSSSAAQAVSSARRATVQLRRKRKSGEYDDAELEAAITHALAMERIAKKHERYLQQEEQAQRGVSSDASAMSSDEKDTNDASGQQQSVDISKAFEETQRDLAENLSEIPQELAQEIEKLMQEYGDLINESMEDLGGELMEELSVVDTQMDAEDVEALQQKHRVKELQEIAKADAKYLKAIFEKYAADRKQAASGVGQTAGAMNGFGGMIDMRGGSQTVPTAVASIASQADAPVEGGSVDVSI